MTPLSSAKRSHTDCREKSREATALLCLPSKKIRPILFDAILGRNAIKFRSSTASTASWRSSALSTLLEQFVQLHRSQYSPEEKHSQYLASTRCSDDVVNSNEIIRHLSRSKRRTYNFKQREFRQLQLFVSSYGDDDALT